MIGRRTSWSGTWRGAVAIARPTVPAAIVLNLFIPLLAFGVATAHAKAREVAHATAQDSAAGAAERSARSAPMPPPLAPVDVRVADLPLDEGGAVLVMWKVPPEAPAGSIASFVIRRSMTQAEAASQRLERRKASFEAELKRLETQGVAPEQARTQAAAHAQREVPSPVPGAPEPLQWIDASEVPAAAPGAEMTTVVSSLDPAQEYQFMVVSRSADATEAGAAPSAAVRGEPGLFLGKRIYLLGWILFISGSVIGFILVARGGRPMRIRRLAALEAVDEAVGRATEMGRSVLFLPGIQDMDNVQTIAGITVLSRVAKTVAEYDATIEVPTARSLTMQASREAVQASYMQAGRLESFNPDSVSYITDEQFGFVAYVGGRMVREKPAACFYMGCFFAESLILAETGNSIGAIQIAGTAESSQLPFFVAACDYTLIGEEFFAASAYLSGEPDQLGSIKGQDVGKALAIAVIVVASLALAVQAIVPQWGIGSVAAFIRSTLTS